MKKIALVGSTGSIGRQVTDVVRRCPDKFKIVALAAFSDEATLKKQAKQLGLRPSVCALASRDRRAALAVAETEEADVVFNAAGGFAGLEYSVAALRAGKALALANKETLVCGGDLIVPLSERAGAEILPVDSEHSAIWQCLHFQKNAPVRRLILTASGGAFYGVPHERLLSVTPAQALAHPTWKMGKKITVDSATMMNKGYEVIEAHFLFGTPYGQITAVVQRQSIVHSLVEFTDGACLAQMSYPTMEIPIQLALSYPQRLSLAVEPLNFRQAFSLEFAPLFSEQTPCYRLAVACGEQGGTLPCVLNAADEVAVEAFLRGQIAFTDIFRVADKTVQSSVREEVTEFAQLAEIDRQARRTAQKIIDRLQ